MIDSQILQPVVVLMAWTMIMWLWMYATRIPAMSKAKIQPDDARKTGTLDERLPEQVQWKAHNYNHLHEQPTVFYAVALLLALIGWGDGMNALIAWIYVGLRITHSLVQATANVVMVRFVLFALSSIALIALIFHAAIAVFDLHPSKAQSSRSAIIPPSMPSLSPAPTCGLPKQSIPSKSNSANPLPPATTPWPGMPSTSPASPTPKKAGGGCSAKR